MQLIVEFVLCGTTRRKEMGEAMLTQLEYARTMRVLIFNYRKKPSLSQINLLTNTELGELLNELPIQQKKTLS